MITRIVITLVISMVVCFAFQKQLMELLRRHRAPVTGQSLADDLGVSLRTFYRDIATLQGQGSEIEGEPGLGYVLKPGFTLPPMMFSIDELEAL
ncbi:MAG: HTH domain-containing protein, partial [Verrucomicrobia bacterium]|nr:HTH domain-containing protein [Verrucomicrobiota bacterium]